MVSCVALTPLCCLHTLTEPLRKGGGLGTRKRSMLKRLYADNFRCLENFEIRFGESNLLLGRNGTGKTSVFDVLRKIQDLVVRGLKVDQVFPAHDLSANHLRNEQRFEIDTQPWLAEAVQNCGDSIDQLVVASHHPNTIDYMAGSSGRWFSREETGPARVSDQPVNTIDGLSISETVARGWE